MLETYAACSGIFSANLNSIEPSYLMTMIRLGRKYEISTFTKTALTYLRKLFPRELALWRASCPEVAKIVAGSKGFLFDIINLAYENQIPSILPAAFLDLFAHHTLVCLMAPAPSVPADIYFMAQNEIISGIERPGQRGAMLVSEAMPTCMLSRVTFVDSFYCALRSYWSNYDPETAATSQIDYEIPCQNCKDIHRCAKAFIDFIVCLSEMGRIHCGTIHIPAGLKDLDFPVHLCDHCKVALQTSFKGSSHLWWQCLLELAQLPHQQESKDFDDRE